MNQKGTVAVAFVLLLFALVFAFIVLQIDFQGEGFVVNGYEKIPEEVLKAAQNSICVEEGVLTEVYFYNDNSKTWWIDLDMKPEFRNEICNPACVVEENLKVEINYRCGGLKE